MNSFGTLMKESQGNEIALTALHESLCLFHSRLTRRQENCFFGYDAKQISHELVQSEKRKPLKTSTFFTEIVYIQTF